MKHDQIWAPWRLAYVQGGGNDPEQGVPAEKLLPGADPECFLCQAVADEQDRRRHVVRNGAFSIVVLNRFPYNNGHLLVAPRKHVGRLELLTGDEQLAISRDITQLVAAMERLMRPDGFNIGLNLGRVAGAGLPGHVHWHVVPRWSGDTNFMPVLAGVHVIPQSLDALWEALTAELAHEI